FFSSRRRHTRFSRDWSSDVCSSDLIVAALADLLQPEAIVLRLSRAAAKVMKAYGDASVLYGTLANPVVRFKQFGVYFQANILLRSEERRVGKACRTRGWG